MSQVSDPSFLIQKQVRENTQDLESYMLDLKAWEDGMKKKEQKIFGNGDQVEMKESSVSKDDVSYVKRVFEDGKRQMKNGKWELAIASFTKAINKYKKNPAFFIKRAKCYLKLNKLKEAEVDCTRALSLDPKILKAKFMRSQARERLKNYRGACLDLQDILLLDPPNEAAKNAMIRVRTLYFEILKSQDSRLFDEKVEEDESLSVIHSSMVGSSEKAAEDAELEDKIQKSNIEKQRGNDLVKQQKWEEAKEAYSKAILIYPNDAIFYANRALCHMNTDNPSRAVLDCSVALLKNPRYVKAYLRRAAARKITDDLWGARSDVKKTLLLEPNNSQAKTLLEELNVLIEQKVYRDFGLQDDESSLSSVEKEAVRYGPMDQWETQPMETENLKLATVDKIPVQDENKMPSESGDFTQVFPINKALDARSKKPLKRISIMFTGKKEEKDIISRKSHDEDLPPISKLKKTSELGNSSIFPESPKVEISPKRSPRRAKLPIVDYLSDEIKHSSSNNTTQTGGKSSPEKPACEAKLEIMDSLLDKSKRSSPDKKSLSAKKAASEDKSILENSTGSSLNDICNDNDFKYIFPINKKPHQRSKTALKRIPIKFL